MIYPPYQQTISVLTCALSILIGGLISASLRKDIAPNGRHEAVAPVVVCGFKRVKYCSRYIPTA